MLSLDRPKRGVDFDASAKAPFFDWRGSGSFDFGVIVWAHL
jgi:hypothetical protein